MEQVPGQPVESPALEAFKTQEPEQPGLILKLALYLKGEQTQWPPDDLSA